MSKLHNLNEFTGYEYLGRAYVTAWMLHITTITPYRVILKIKKIVIIIHIL